VSTDSGNVGLRDRPVKGFGWVPDLPDARDFTYSAPEDVLTKLPKKADLRSKMPKVYDQGELGSATANAIAAAFQFEQRKQEQKDFMPSRLFVYYNERALMGTIDTDSGAMIRDGMKSVAKVGVCAETTWPYDVAKFTEKPPRTAYVEGKKHQALVYRRVLANLHQMQGCLASGYPFVFGFSVYESFMSPDVAKTGKVPLPPRGEQLLGGHAVLAVGYDDADQSFIVRNSWGTGWGMKGYCTMPYGYLTDPQLARDFWAIYTVEPDQSPRHTLPPMSSPSRAPISGFDTLHFHAVQPDAGASADAEGFRGVRASGFATDEAAARFYLDQILAPRPGEEFRDIVASEEPARVPGLTLLDVQRSPVAENRVVRFRQAHRGVPVFGSRVVVELGAAQEFVSADLKTGRVEVDAVAGLAPADAVAHLIDALEMETFTPAKAPALVFFDVGGGKLVLAYLVEDVPARPPEAWAEAKPPADFRAVALDAEEPEAYNYFVDATNGEILFSYPSGPTLDIASVCRGVDDLGEYCEFSGRKLGGAFEMVDPDRLVTTHDIQFGEIDGAPTPPPVAAPGANWGESNRAAVSAHVNATRVHDFYEAVLHRDGIDGKGMALVSVVNCTRAGLPAPPEWINAQWRPKEGRMVYGQRHLGNGAFQSLATFLDVIAHELTHGVTSHTAALVYLAEPGALNESMSDIFGVIVNNWYLRGEASNVDDWGWEIGPGLGSGGEPLRDASQPTRCGCPDHMRDYRVVDYDLGGVHINSGIHTLAAVNVLRSTDPAGARHFTPREVAGLYYSTLQRLTAQATFAEARKQLRDVVASRYAGFPEEAAAKVAAVDAAYDAVGIAPP